MADVEGDQVAELDGGAEVGDVAERENVDERDDHIAYSPTSPFDAPDEVVANRPAVVKEPKEEEEEDVGAAPPVGIEGEVPQVPQAPKREENDGASHLPVHPGRKEENAGPTDLDIMFGDGGLIDDRDKPPKLLQEEEEEKKIDVDYMPMDGKFPVLIVGSRLDKELPLRPHRWTKIGRSPTSHLLLDVPGVSREHCMLRWDPSQSKIEFRNLSSVGTSINEVLMRQHDGRVGGERLLQHGDRIMIASKAKKYTLVLDLRPVGMGYRNPVEMVPEGTALSAKHLAARVKKRDRLRAELAKWESKCSTFREELFLKERETAALTAERTMLIAQAEMEEEEIKLVQKEEELLIEKLAESRVEWQEKLKKNADDSNVEAGPLRDKAAEVQVMLEKLKMKRAELERSLYPEKFEYLEIGASSQPPSQAPSRAASLPSKRGLPSDAASCVHDDAAGEDQALTDMMPPPEAKRLKLENGGDVAAGDAP